MDGDLTVGIRRYEEDGDGEGDEERSRLLVVRGSYSSGYKLEGVVKSVVVMSCGEDDVEEGDMNEL